ncbi:MAG: hypothetical protein QOH32_437 [Bradyrhizobium sp.]|nr:hypothetical protein [Bradyrhizobium sp.]
MMSLRLVRIDSTHGNSTHGVLCFTGNKHRRI